MSTERRSHEPICLSSSSTSSREIFHFLKRLHYGVFHFPNDNSSSISLGSSEENDESYKRFVFVPTGYAFRHEQSLWRILNSLDITNLPTLVMNVASSSGNNQHLNNTETLLLETAIDLCESVGAWIVPERPWNYDRSAYSILTARNSYYSKKQVKSVQRLNVDSNSSKRRVVTLGLFSFNEPVQNNEADSEFILGACDYLSKAVTDNVIPFVSSTIQPNIPVVTIDKTKINEKYLPCSNLTHYVIFQNYREKLLFQQKLSELVPDLLLAFGNLTRSAKQQITSTVSEGSPVSLICGSDATRKFAVMFQHAENELIKNNLVESEPLDIATSTSTDTGEKFKSHAQPGSTISLPPLTMYHLDEDYQLINTFLNNWPLNYQKENVVLVDLDEEGIREEEVARLSKTYRERLLIAISCAFSHVPVKPAKQFIAESKSALEKTTAAVVAGECVYAESCLHILQQTVRSKKLVTIVLQTLLVLTTFLGIVAPVIYAKLYGDSNPWSANENENAIFIADDINHPEGLKEKRGADLKPTASLSNSFLASIVTSFVKLDALQFALYSATILIPVIIVYLQKQNNQEKVDTPLMSWYALEVATAQLESEIIKFRSQVDNYSEYSYDRDAGHGIVKDENCTEKFWGTLVSKSYEIWRDVRHLVPNFYQKNLIRTIEEFNNQKSGKTKNASEKTWGPFVSKSREIFKRVHRIKATDKNYIDKDVKESKVRQIVIGKLAPDDGVDAESGEMASLLPVLSVSVDEDESNAQDDTYHYDPTNWVKKTISKSAYMNYPSYDAFFEVLTDNNYSQLQEAEQRDQTKSLKDINRLQSSDYLVPMTPNEYINKRLDPQLMRKHKDLSYMENRRKLIKTLIVYLTSLTTILAALSYQWVIPIVLGFTAALGMDQVNQNFGKRYNGGRIMVSKLEKLKSWWLNLSDDDKHLHANMDRLVVEAERIILEDAVGVFGNTVHS